jgi:Glycosyltransferase family 87
MKTMSSASEAPVVDAPLSGSGTQPRAPREERQNQGDSLLSRIVSPILTLKQLNVLCWVAFVAFLAVPAGKALKDRLNRENVLQQVAQTDFIYSYGLGRMFNQYPAAQLYDYELQKKVYTGIAPTTETYGPNPYAPFVGILFRPFARLPFFGAYLLWLSISICLYIAGLTMMTGRFLAGAPLRRSLIFCLALSFFPFCWLLLTGQISVIGFFALALAFREEGRNRPIRSGLTLSLCLYKPTLLVLFLPMLLITRRYKTLTGFAAGGIVLAIFATVVQGPGIWPSYIHLLLSFGSGAAQPHSFKIHWKYTDLPSFLSLIFGGPSVPGYSVMLVLASSVARSLWRAWRKAAGAGGPASTLVWAATITWTLILNIYTPIYDCVFVVLAVIATAGVLKDLPDKHLQRRFTLLWLLILASSWVTLDLARDHGFQIISVCLALLGIQQLSILGKMPAVRCREAVAFPSAE